MYCKYVSNVNAIYTQSLQINHSLLSTTHHPSRISHDQTASIMLPLFPWKVSINVSNNQSICPTMNNETIDFVASGRTSACITSELMSLLIKVNPQGTSLFWTQNAAIIQILWCLRVFYLFCFLLMRSLCAQKASIFNTSDFLFLKISFKISAFVHYLYIIIYNIDILFRFLNETTHCI